MGASTNVVSIIIPGFGKLYPMTGGKKGGRPDQMSGEAEWRRLDLLIEVLHQGNRAGFARRIGFSPQQLGDYRKHGWTVSKEMANAIVATTRVDFEWLRRGNDDGVPPDLKEALELARRNPRKKREKRKKRGKTAPS
jgi:hypothetical protein